MPVDLYFSPMACSLASRISLYEAGAQDVQFVEVDPKTKRTMAGANYFDVYSLGLVPYLRLDDGSAVSENAAILQYIASRYPDSELAPKNERERAQLQQWLCFIGTELHKGMFIPLFDKNAPEGTREHTLKKYESRWKYLNNHLAGRQYLLDRFTVADAYLYTILNWTVPTQVDLTPYPAIKSYYASLQTRPSVVKAFSEEMALYKAELARNKAA
jgi:glutathione S-transferase